MKNIMLILILSFLLTSQLFYSCKRPGESIPLGEENKIESSAPVSSQSEAPPGIDEQSSVSSPATSMYKIDDPLQGTFAGSDKPVTLQPMKVVYSINPVRDIPSIQITFSIEQSSAIEWLYDKIEPDSSLKKIIVKLSGTDSFIEQVSWQWTGPLKKGELKRWELWVKVYEKGWRGGPYIVARQNHLDLAGKSYFYLAKAFNLSTTSREVPEYVRKGIVLRSMVGINDKWIPMYPEDLPDEINNKITLLNNGWKIIPANLLPQGYLSNPVYNYKDPSTGKIRNPVKQ